MIRYSRSGFDDPSEAAVLHRKVRQLAEDLESLAHGRAPSADELRAAPIITNWSIMMDFHKSICGHVTGHPQLPGSLRRAMTSQLIVDGRDCGWMRTASRYYRLGGAMPEGFDVDEDDKFQRGTLRLV